MPSACLDPAGQSPCLPLYWPAEMPSMALCHTWTWWTYLLSPPPSQWYSCSTEQCQERPLHYSTSFSPPGELWFINRFIVPASQQWLAHRNGNFLSPGVWWGCERSFVQVSCYPFLYLSPQSLLYSKKPTRVKELNNPLVKPVGFVLLFGVFFGVFFGFWGFFSPCRIAWRLKHLETLHPCQIWILV